MTIKIKLSPQYGFWNLFCAAIPTHGFIFLRPLLFVNRHLAATILSAQINTDGILTLTVLKPCVPFCISIYKCAGTHTCSSKSCDSCSQYQLLVRPVSTKACSSNVSVFLPPLSLPFNIWHQLLTLDHQINNPARQCLLCPRLSSFNGKIACECMVRRQIFRNNEQ